MEPGAILFLQGSAGPCPVGRVAAPYLSAVFRGWVVGGPTAVCWRVLHEADLMAAECDWASEAQPAACLL